MRGTACGRPQNIESLFADKTLNTVNAYRESDSRAPAMTADEREQPGRPISLKVDITALRRAGQRFSLTGGESRAFNLSWDY